jgi:periplasmic protein CpxP/Spy
MNRLFTSRGRRWIVLTGVATALVSLSACAHQGGEGGGSGWGGMRQHRGNMTPEQMNSRIDKMVERTLSSVDATPDQKQKVGAIAKQAAGELRPLRERHQEARKKAAELLSAATIDRAALERVRAEELQSADAVSKRMTQAIADAAEVLNPEQRVKLRERMQKRWGRGPAAELVPPAKG